MLNFEMISVLQMGSFTKLIRKILYSNHNLLSTERRDVPTIAFFLICRDYGLVDLSRA